MIKYISQQIAWIPDQTSRTRVRDDKSAKDVLWWLYNFTNFTNFITISILPPPLQTADHYYPLFLLDESYFLL